MEIQNVQGCKTRGTGCNEKGNDAQKKKLQGRAEYSRETNSTASNAHLLRDKVHATLALLLLQLQGDAANRAALDALHQVLLVGRNTKMTVTLGGMRAGNSAR